MAVKNCEVELSSCSSRTASPAAADDSYDDDDTDETTGGVAELSLALGELTQEALLAHHASVGGIGDAAVSTPRKNMMRVLGASYLALPDSGVVELHLVMELAPGGDLCSFINHPTVRCPHHPRAMHSHRQPSASTVYQRAVGGTVSPDTYS